MLDIFKELKDIPRSVAVIMDGNGRWAKKRLMPRSMGHRAGMERVKDIVRWSSDIGVEALTLYAFSTENWKRPKEEVNVLMSLLIEYLKKELAELLSENVRFKVIGIDDGMPKEVLAILRDSEEATKNNTGLHLNVAVNYGGRRELTDAVKGIVEDVKNGKISDVDEHTISDYLYTAGEPDPDLVIRTSGELRLSNFLLYQIAYSELYFTDVSWPDFDENEYFKALKEYEKRQRRFGAV